MIIKKNFLSCGKARFGTMQRQELVMQPGMGQLLGPTGMCITCQICFGEQNLLFTILQAVRKDRYEQLTAPLFGNGNGSKDAPVFDLGSESLEGFREKYVSVASTRSPLWEKEFLLQSICCDVLVNILLKGRENSAPDWLSELSDDRQKKPEPGNFTGRDLHACDAGTCRREVRRI